MGIVSGNGRVWYNSIMKPLRQNMLVTKASGEQEPFIEEKLRRSLERAKVSAGTAEKIVSHIKEELVSGSFTRDIYRHAFSLLKRFERPAAARYSLKRAIMELGPEGHPFENLVAEIFSAQGYSVQVSEMVQGACVSHEVDVVAEKQGKRLMIECKFHNQQGIRSDVKVALYIQARFKDIQKAGRFDEAWLVTNTELTSDAVQYASCVGMKTIGWNHPAEGNLQDLIEKTGLHPFTCLTSLSSSQKRFVMDKGITLCKDILKEKPLLKSMGLNDIKISRIEQEIGLLCKP